MRGDFREFQKKLLDWFDAHRRPLPWRVAPSLYKTVVSEFMLQQTQVDTVVPYFTRWMRELPDFATLAGAPEPRVLKLWEGLGYYSRARNLHRLAASIVSDGIPDSPAVWRRRPGIGPYTAAAISSIAQGQIEPVIDGNVIRVLARLQNDAAPLPSSAAGRKRFLALATRLIDPSRPGDFNEALMELGATVCRKAAPACPLCPVAAHCKAHAAGTALSLPVIPRKAPALKVVHRLWIRRQGAILLQFYPPDAPRLANLAELPMLPAPPASPPLLSRSRTIGNTRFTEHIHALPPSHPALINHLSLSALSLSAPENHLSLSARWVPIAELQTVALSAPHRKWIDTLLKSPVPLNPPQITCPFKSL
jgi:A/G-specific adenine glycosylase